MLVFVKLTLCCTDTPLEFKSLRIMCNEKIITQTDVSMVIMKMHMNSTVHENNVPRFEVKCRATKGITNMYGLQKRKNLD